MAQQEHRTPTRKVVLADYFLGFSTRALSGGARPWRLYYESEAEAGLKPPRCDAAFSGDLYVNGEIKDIASTYYPAIGPYDVTDPDVAEYHVLLAKAAGIDGFMAEFTLGQEAQLLSLVRAACRYDFRIGVNWISQSHLGENVWRDRAEAMAKARDLVRFMAEKVYKPCGVTVGGRPLLLVFLAHPREPANPSDPFFSPAEVRELRGVMANAGCDADFLVLPWERLPDLPGGRSTGERVWDGYFPWVWLTPGAPAGTGWTHEASRESYVALLRDYYAMAERVKWEGRIGTYIGAVCPGFDDHRGQAWGEGYRRHLPADGGETLRQAWDELVRSGAETALIVTWNDWVESSQIEPSLELGDRVLCQCAGHIAAWKGVTRDERLLRLPERLLRARRDVRFAANAGVSAEHLDPLAEGLDRAANAIASYDRVTAESLLEAIARRLTTVRAGIVANGLHAFWEHGFDSVGVERVGRGDAPAVNRAGWSGVAFDAGATISFAVADDVRSSLHAGHLAAKLCLEYLDEGTDFVEVLVDAADSRHEVIASFKKTGTGRWLKASMELVNVRFVRGRPGGADLSVRQRPGAGGGVRSVRIDGTIYCARATS